MVRFRHCFYCDKRLSRRTATTDHVIPRSKGGSDSPKNIVDACRKCNCDKGCLTLHEFRAVMAFRVGVPKVKDFKFPGEIVREN
jgi:5-methylcytosine-specific restriction endonuclease McrA